MKHIRTECDKCGEGFWRLGNHPALCPMCGNESPSVKPEQDQTNPSPVGPLTIFGMNGDVVIVALLLTFLVAVAYALMK